MEVNYLHIWARNEYMMIALPNYDKSYTVTLFMPFDIFKTLTTEKAVLDFFKANFADSIPLLGEYVVFMLYFYDTCDRLTRDWIQFVIFISQSLWNYYISE